MIHYISDIWTVAALLVGIQCVGASDEGSVVGNTIDVGNQKQLFIDELFFESVNNVTLHVQTATKTGERVLVSDKPWENATLNWFSVMNDDGKCRMWYECYDVEGWPTSDDTSFCYAESTDGIQWLKPSLGLFSYHGSTDNNILFRQVGSAKAHSRVHGTDVLKDPHAPPEARYKAVSQGMFTDADPPHRVAGMYSPDGLHWTRLSQPICNVFADSQYSAFWNNETGQYELFGRVSGHGRAIGRSVSSSFDHFSPFALVLQTDEFDPPDSDLYNPAALKYPYAQNVFMMFPSLYRHSTETLDIHIAVSRDGIHWSWPERGKPFINLGSDDAFDSGSLYMGQGMIRVDNELWQYYSASRLKHNEAKLDAFATPENQRVYSRVISRLDGLVAAEAGEEEGFFITPRLTFHGSVLQLNVRTGASGKVRVGLLDDENEPIPGYTVDDCIPITGDHIETNVAWTKGTDLSRWTGKTIKMIVEMQDASLFSFCFTP